MKKLFTLLAITCLVIQSWAQTTDYLQQKDFQSEKKKIYESISGAKKQLNDVKKADAAIGLSIDSIARRLLITADQANRNYDSILKSNDRVNSLQAQFDGQKLISRGLLIMLFLLIFVLFGVVFFLLFKLKQQTEMQQLSMDELGKKTSERIDTEAGILKEYLQGRTDILASASADLQKEVAAKFLSIGADKQQLEQKINDGFASLNGLHGTLSQDVGKLRQAQVSSATETEEKLSAFRKEVTLNVENSSKHITRLEEELSSLKQKK